MQRGEGECPEHQMTHHFVRTPHPQRPAAMIVFQPAVDTPGRAALAVTHLVGHAVPDRPEPLRLFGQLPFQTGSRAGIDADDRDMTQSPAMLFDLGHVIRAVHQIIQVDDARGGYRGERERRLAVMYRRRGQHATDRDFPIGGVDVQLVANPAFLVALGIAFGAHITMPWQIGEHPGQAHAALAFDPPDRRGRADLILRVCQELTARSDRLPGLIV